MRGGRHQGEPAGSGQIHCGRFQVVRPGAPGSARDVSSSGQSRGEQTPMIYRAAILVLALAMGRAQDQPPRPDRMGVTNTGPYDYGVMGPPATPAIVAAAGKAVTKPLPGGPFEPTWDS